jgi:hypothetical protein
MPDAIWSGLIGALVTLAGALFVHFSFVRPEHEKQLRLARKEARRERKRRARKALTEARPLRLLQPIDAIGRGAREAETLANAVMAADDDLPELSREIGTHEAWLRLARVCRELPKQIRRVMFNTMRKRAREKVELYKELCEYLELPEVEMREADRWTNLSPEKRRSVAIHHAIHATYENLVVDLLQVGTLGMSAPMVQLELTDYMISDEEVDAYILDWVRRETTADFLERALQEPEAASSFVEAAGLSAR